jgi:hypothetical protein
MPAGVQTISDWFAAHEPVVYKHINLGQQQHKKVYDKIFKVGNTNVQIEDQAVWSGPNTFDRHLENETIEPKKITTAWTSRKRAVFYAAMLTASKESLIGERTDGMLRRKAERMGLAGEVTPDWLCGLFLDRGFTDITIGDGKPLYATDHNLGQHGTFSNMTSDALSHAGIESAIVALSQIRNFDGIPEALDVKCIVIHPTKWPLLQTLMRTPKRTGGLFNDISFVHDETGAWDMVPNRFLQTQTFWHLITEVTTRGDGLFFKWLEKLNYVRDNIQAQRTAQFIGAQGMNYGAYDPHGAYASNSPT